MDLTQCEVCKIIKLVCAKFEVEPQELHVTGGREYNIVEARYSAIGAIIGVGRLSQCERHFSRKPSQKMLGSGPVVNCGTVNISQAAEFFGYQDHTSVLHALTRIQAENQLKNKTVSIIHEFEAQKRAS